MNNLDRQVNAQECFFLRPSISSICRPAFIGFFVLYFLLMQTLPTLAALTDGMNSIMSAGQGKGHSKKGCRCCKPPDCHCDMKKDQTHRPMDFDLVLSTRFGNHTLEDTGFSPGTCQTKLLQQYNTQNSLDVCKGSLPVDIPRHP